MNVNERARAYIDRMPPAISGNGGHNATFKVACVLWNGFALEHDEVMELLRHYNQRCEPQWRDWELEHKAREAAKTSHQKSRGHLLDKGKPGRKSYKRGIPTNHGVVLGYFSPLSEPATGAEDSESPSVERKSKGTNREPVIVEPAARKRPAEDTSESCWQTPYPFLFDGWREDSGPPEDRSSRVRSDSGDISTGDHAEPGESPTKPPTAGTDYKFVAEASEFDDISDQLDSSLSPVALDLETYGPGKDGALNPRRGDIRLLQLALPGEPPWIIDLQKTGYDLGRLQESVENKEVIAHNAKFDLAFLQEKCGVRYPERVLCTYTASALLTAGSDEKNDLGAVLLRYEVVDLPKDQGKSDWSALTLTDEQMEYAAKDVAYLHELAEKLRTDIENAGLSETLDLELRLIPVVLKMESAGFAVDTDRIETIRKEVNLQAAEWKAKLLEELGVKDLNPNSPKQLRNAFTVIGADLPDTKENTIKGWEGPGQEACNALLKYRHATKQAQQCETLLKSIDPDGRIRASFKPLGAETARFSCSGPNLQNISNGPLRECFRAESGMRLICADYSQIELRIAAAITGEEKMLEAYRNGRDLHRLTAANILGKSGEEITSDDRQLAKAVNFGLLFGQGAKGLQKYAETNYGIQITEARAAELRDAFFQTYPQLKAWHDDTHTTARSSRSHEIRTRQGRRRLLPEGPENEWKRFSRALNTPVQGGAADGLKKALVLLDERLPDKARIVSTIHDEVIVEVPEGVVKTCSEIVKRSMEEAMSSIYPEVPIIAQPSDGGTWTDAK